MFFRRVFVRKLLTVIQIEQGHLDKDAFEQWEKQFF